MAFNTMFHSSFLFALQTSAIPNHVVHATNSGYTGICGSGICFWKEFSQKHMPHGASCKNFWKFCKPFFPNKTNNFDDKIILVEKGEVVSKNEKIATHFNDYFNKITEGLNIKK